MDAIGNILAKTGYSKEDIIGKPETEEERKARIKKDVELKCELENKTVGNLHEKDGYDCPICNNRGWSLVVNEDEGSYYEAYRTCKCMRVRSMIAKLERSGLKNAIKECSFDKYEAVEEWQKRLKETAQRFATDDLHTWLFFGGMSGTGKTHLCTAVAAHYLRQNKAVRYMLWRDEVTKIKAVVNDSEKYNELISEIKNAEVLYIDDLFKMGKDASGNVPNPTTADINVAYEIVNYRYNNKDLVTIISSERTLRDIIAIDDALGGRISEMTVPHGYYIGINYDPKKNYRTKGVIEL